MIIVVTVFFRGYFWSGRGFVAGGEMMKYVAWDAGVEADDSSSLSNGNRNFPSDT